MAASTYALRERGVPLFFRMLTPEDQAIWDRLAPTGTPRAQLFYQSLSTDWEDLTTCLVASHFAANAAPGWHARKHALSDFAVRALLP